MYRHRDANDPKLYHFPTPELRSLRTLGAQNRSWYEANQRYAAANEALSQAEARCTSLYDRGLAAIIARFEARGNGTTAPVPSTNNDSSPYTLFR